MNYANNNIIGIKTRVCAFILIMSIMLQIMLLVWYKCLLFSDIKTCLEKSCFNCIYLESFVYYLMDLL